VDGRTCQHDRDVSKDQATIPYLPIAFCLFFHRYNTMVNGETEVNLILAGIINQLFFSDSEEYLPGSVWFSYGELSFVTPNTKYKPSSLS